MPAVSAANATKGSSWSRRPSSADERGAAGAVEVVDERKDPRDRQLRRALQVRITDAADESLERVDRGDRGLVVADLGGRHRRREEQLGLAALVQRVGLALRLPDPGAALRHLTAHLPVQPKNAEDVRQRRDVVRQEPADGDSDVLLVRPQPLRPLRLPLAGPVGVLHHRGEVLGVTPLRLVLIGSSHEPFGGELADRREHAEPRARLRDIDVHEAVSGERIEQIEDAVLGDIGDVRRRFDRPASFEDRQRGQQVQLGVVEQPEAPLHRGPDRALPLRKVDRPVPSASR